MGLQVFVLSRDRTVRAATPASAGAGILLSTLIPVPLPFKSTSGIGSSPIAWKLDHETHIRLAHDAWPDHTGCPGLRRPAGCTVIDPTGTPLNVRSGPNGQIVGTLRKGAKVEVGPPL